MSGTVQIQFFQVTAAAIPTLLIAGAVSLNKGTPFVTGPSQRGLIVRLARTFVATATVGAIFAGEIFSLTALLTNRLDYELAVVAFIGTYVALVALLIELLYPWVAALPKLERMMAIGILGAFAVTGIGVVVVMHP